MRLSLNFGVRSMMISRPSVVPNAYQNILVIGASIMEQTMTPIETKALMDATYANSSCTVYNRAVSGWTSQTLRNSIDAILLDYTPTIPNMAVVMHIGGNDVSSNRPYSSDLNLATLQANLEYIINAVATAGYTLYMANLTYRDYFDVNRNSEILGSDPYNKQLLNGLVPNGFSFADGRPWVDLYTTVYNNPQYLSADGIHMNAEGIVAFRQYLVDTLGAHNFTGIAPIQISKDIQGLILNSDFSDSVTTDWVQGTERQALGFSTLIAGTYTVSAGVATVVGGSGAYGIYQNFDLSVGIEYTLSIDMAVVNSVDVKFRVYDGYDLDVALLAESTAVTSSTLTTRTVVFTPTVDGKISLYLRCSAPDLAGRFANVVISA